MSTLKARVLFSFVKLSISEKILKGKVIIAGISSQGAKLPNLPYTAAQLTAANDDLDKKAQAAEDGGKTAIKARNASEKVWNNIFKTTASYVNLIANGDVLFINQCGLDASAEHTTTKSIPGGLVNFEGTPIVKSAGAVEIKYDADTNAKAYASIITSTNAVIEQHGDMIIVTVGNEKVYILLDTHHKTVANELPSGTELSLYGAAFNGYGVGQLTQAKNIKAL